MACSNQEYFVGNGEILLRRVADDCGDPLSGWFKVGDANQLSISIDQAFNDHFESTSGLRLRSARWLTSTTAAFTMSVQNLSIENLVALLQGTDSGSVAGAAVVDEIVEHCYLDQWVFTQYPGISSVTVTSNAGVNTLTLGVDYELDARNGGIKILDDTDIVNNTIEVSYTHVGIEGLVSALAAGTLEYQVRFNGVNRTAPSKPVIVELKRAQFNAAEELSLIGEDITSLTFTGALLGDANGEYFTVMKSNNVV